MNLEINSKKELSNIIHYASSIADHLRKLIRNKTSRFNNFTEYTEIYFIHLNIGYDIQRHYRSMIMALK